MLVKGVAALSVFLVAAGVSAQQRAAFRDSRERISYALGVETGNGFKSRAVDLDPDAFAQGLKDAISGRTPALTEDQMRAAIAELQASVKQREFDLRTGRTEMNRKASEAFLVENRKQDGVVTLPSGVQYKVLKVGAGRKPTDADTIECAYRGTLITGTEFDSSSRGGSSSTVKVDQAIAGVREALKLMTVGSKWQVVVPPGLATGPRLAMVVVPPDQALVYEIELLAIKDKS